MSKTAECVLFKSTEPWYSLEECGSKPHTIRVVDRERRDEVDHAKRIVIVNGDHTFMRRITGVYDITTAAMASGLKVPIGHQVIDICWERHEGVA